MGRSEDEIILRDSAAEEYNSWYLQRGAVPVRVEDTTILNKLDISNSDHFFLDAGCGTGRLTLQIADQYPHLNVSAFDLSNKSLDVLSRKNVANVSTRQFDFSKDSISALNLENKFDKILSMQMIQHLDTNGAEHALNELYRALNPTGSLVIELYNFSGLTRIAERTFVNKTIRKITRTDLFYEYRYSADEFRNFVLQNTKFKSVKLYGCQNIPRKILNRVPALAHTDIFLSNFAFSRFLGYYFICICRK